MPRFFAWLLLLILPLAACAQAPAGPPQAGKDYEVLPEGQRWQRAPDGRIEVPLDLDEVKHAAELFAKRGLDGAFEEAAATAFVAEISNLKIPVIGRDALIANKRATGREKDLVDVHALERKK